MTPSPFEPPVKAGEAGQVADITLQLAENRLLTENVRSRLVARAGALTLTSIRPHWGSLQQDPAHASSYYLAIDAISPAGTGQHETPFLMHIAPASAPSSAVFPKSTLIGRMRLGAGSREVVINTASFGPADAAAIETFVNKVDRAFLPRPQASAPSITVSSTHPESDLPAAFDGFRAVQRATGLNVASIAASPRQSARTLSAAMWSAIRAGWREGYNVEAEPVSLAEPEPTETARRLAAFSRFRVDLGEPVTAARAPLDGDSLSWAQAELGRRIMVGESAFVFEPPEIAVLHARFARPLAAAELCFDTIRRERTAAGYGRVFDFEIALPQDAGVRGAFFCEQWLKLRGRPATLVAPYLASVEEAREHAAVARHFGCTLSFDAAALPDLPRPSQWAGSRWNCRVAAGKNTAELISSTCAALRA